MKKIYQLRRDHALAEFQRVLLKVLRYNRLRVEWLCG